MPIEIGGFGIISYGRIIKGIKCKQLWKLFDPGYYHPLKYLTIKKDRHFSIGKSLTRIGDELAMGSMYLTILALMYVSVWPIPFNNHLNQTSQLT